MVAVTAAGWAACALPIDGASKCMYPVARPAPMPAASKAEVTLLSRIVLSYRK
jgi:hypothetical protein